MKFAKHLESNSIPEWRKAYINYKGLKKRLKAIEKYRKLNHSNSTHNRFQNVISTLVDDSMDDYPSNALPMSKPNSIAPSRTQSSILDNRSSGLQPRNLPIQGLFHHLSFRFGRHQDNTELDRMSRPSIPIQTLQTFSIFEEALKYASEPEQYFFVMLDQDLEKISQFYNEKEKEAETKYEALKMQVQLVRDFANQLSHIDSSYDIIHSEGRLNPANWFRRETNTATDIPNFPVSVEYNGEHHMGYNVARSRLKKAITEYYRSLELLKSYKDLNETGFQKILKKFDKTAGWKASPLYLQKIKQYYWIKSNKINVFMEDTENLYINEFADGHRRRGMAQLRIPEKEEHYTPTAWRTGFYLGLTVALLLRIIQLVIDPNTRERIPNIEYNLQIYACFSLPILFCLGFAVNTLVWHRSHINYKFIFEFDPRDNMDYHQFAELPSLMLLLLLAVMYIDFSQSFDPLIPSELCPLILFVLIMAILTCPFPILYYSSRRWLIISLFRIVLSYLFPIEFRDFFIADELNSLAYSFWTITYFFCAYHWHWDSLSTNCPVKIFWYTPFLACLPPWWRFLQCIRRYQDSHEKVHLVNAIKYTTSIGSTLATGYRRMYPNASMEVVWILFCIINSSYTSIWDIKMDWGLLQPNSKHFLLRNELVFYRWTYYVAAPVNVILRFAWTINAASLGFKGELVGFIHASLEAYRRIQWNFFRLENEHLNNVGNYHAIKEIPLPFAFRDKVPMSIHEEGSIQLPMEPHEITSPAVAITATNLREDLTPVGSFYGRRDFENRQDLDDAVSVSENLRYPRRQPSVVNSVFDRMKSSRPSSSRITDSSSSETEIEEEDSD